MDDLIGRRDVVECVYKALRTPPLKGVFTDTMSLAIRMVNDLPSAQPEREKGEWVYNSPVTMKCNRCGIVIKDWDWHRFKICPNCGADMRGERDE